MQTIEVKAGQNLLDIAIQHAGSIEAVFDIAVANNVPVIDPKGENIKAGDMLVIPTIHDKRVVTYFRRNEIEPASQ